MADNDGAEIFGLLASLPFVRTFGDDDPASIAIDCWHVAPSGDMEADIATGERYAEMMFRLMRESGEKELIGAVLRDIFLSDDWTGLEIGFLSAVGNAAYLWSLH